MKAIVVGAGTAGLAALHALAKGGAEVVALEEKDIAGGRIAGAWRNGYAMDLGAQFAFGNSRSTAGLCRELGLGGELTPFVFKAAMYKKGKFYTAVINNDPKILWRYRKDMMNSQGFGPRGVLQMAGFMPRLLRRRKDLDLLEPERVLDLEEMSAADFALRYGGEEVLEGFLQVVVSNLTLGDSEEIGAGYGLALLWGIMHGVQTLKHGLGTLASTIHERNADSIRLSTPARRIVIENRAVKGVETDEGFMEADAVICATPATAALELMTGLPDAIRGPLSRLRYSSCCHIMLALRDHIFPPGWYGIGFPRREGVTLNLTDNALKSPRYAPEGCGLIHCFSSGRLARELNALEDREIVRYAVKEIQRNFPAMPDEPFFSEIYRWKEAVCLPPPGALRDVDGMKKEGMKEVAGLYLAGEYMYMPSMEAAVQSGLDAAEAVLAGR